MRNSYRKFHIRKDRVRINIRKNSDRPRLSVFKSGRHVYAQLIDDTTGKTIASASTLEKELRLNKKSNCNKDFATKVGALVGERAKKAGVQKVVFDKGGYKYHGVVKNLADAAREFLEF